MNDQPPPPRARMRWPILIVVGAVVLIVSAAALVHTPFVKRLVLRRAVALLDSRFGLTLDATALDYNLLRPSVTLRGLRLSAARTPDDPFVQADRLDVTFPWSLVRGRIAFHAVSATHLTVRIHRAADGSLNLPASRGGGGGTPPAIPIGHLDLSRLDFEYRDEASNVVLALPNLALDTTAARGTVSSQQPGTLRWRDTVTPITTLAGGLTFDGRRVGLQALHLVTGEATADLSGSLDVLVAEPSASLDVSATADVTRASRWADLDPAPAGAATATGRISGPLSALTASLRVRSARLDYQGLTFTQADADLTLDAERLQFSRADTRLAGGTVHLTGTTTFAPAGTALEAGWSGLDTLILTRALAPDVRPRPSARSQGTGSLRLAGGNLAEWDLTARTTLTPGTTAGGQVAGGGTLEGGFATGTWRLTGTVDAGGAPIVADLRGRIDPDTFSRSTLGGTVTSEGLDLARVTELLVEAGLLAPLADPVGGTASLTADVTGTLETPRFDARGRVAGLSAAGLTGFEAEATGSGTIEAAVFDLAVAQGAGNRATIRGTVWPLTERLDAKVDAHLETLASLGVDLPASGSMDVALTATGAFDTLDLIGSAQGRDVRYDGTTIGQVEATFDANAALARIDARLPDLSATVTASVQRGTRQAHVEVRGDGTEIARLLPPGTEPPVSGTMTFTAVADGPVDDWEAATVLVDIARLDARSGELPLGLASPARASYTGGTIDVASLDARVGALLISVSGRLPARASAGVVPAGDTLRAVMTGQLDDVIATARAAGVRDTDAIKGTGPVAVLARVTGSLDLPVAEADIEFGPGSVQIGDLPAASPLQLRTRIDGRQIEVLQATGEWQGSRVTAGAVVPLGLLAPYLPDRFAAMLPAATAPATLTARAGQLTPRVLEPFLDPETLAQLQGTLTASADLRAASLDVTAIEGEVRLDTVNLTIAGLPVTQSEPTRLVAGRGVARVAAWEWQAPDSVIRVGGQVDLTGMRAALLVGGRFDMRLLGPLLAGSGVSVIGGIEPRLAVRGDVTSPEIEGEIVLANAEARVADPRIAITDVNGLVVLSPTGLTLTRLDGRINGGTLSGAGRLDYGTGASAPGRLTATITGVALDYPAGLRSEINADLGLALEPARGAEDSRARLSGTVTVTRGGYREPIGVVTGLLAALRNRRVEAGPAGGDSALRRVDLDVRLVTDDDLVVRNNVAQAQLGADLRLIGTAAAPGLSGRAVLREGGALSLGRNRYTIDSGTIDFSNPAVIEPNLNVQAHTRAGGEDIALTLTGTPETLDVGLRSTSAPELGEADVASILLTGRRLDQIPGAEARIVGEEVLGYLSGDILGVAGRVVGLDAIRLGGVDDDLRRDSASIATAADPTSRMTFVKSLGDQLEVTLSQSLRSGDAQTWIVDYLPVRRLDLRLVSRDDSLRSYQFRHDVSLGDPATLAAAERPARVTQRVSAVTFEGTLGVPEAALRGATRLAVGDTFEAGTWQLDRDRLEAVLDRASFAEARVSSRSEDRDGGVALLYRIESGPRTVLEVSGHDVAGDVRQAIVEIWRASVSDDGLREEVRALVRRALADDGHLRAVVDVALDTATPGEKTMRVRVEPGARTARRAVRLDADDPALGERLERQFGRARLLDLAVHEPGTLQQELAQALRALGYLRASVRVAEPQAEQGTAVWVVTVRAGEPFSLGEVRLDGGGPQAASAQADLDSGEFIPGSRFAPQSVDTARTAVTTSFHRAGYADARVTARVAVDDVTHLAHVTFAVEEGPRQVLDAVAITGNRTIRDDVITRALDLPAHEPLAADAWLQARTRVFQTGLFRRVDVETVPADAAAPGGTTPITMKVNVQEWPALRLRYGLEVSEEWDELDPLKGRNLTPGLSADLTRRSLFGRAVTLGLASQYRQQERANRLFIGTPTLWGRAIESLITVQQVRTELPGEIAFIRSVASLSWEQRTRIGRAWQLGYSYRYERNHTYDPAPVSDPLFPVFDITENVARLIGTAAYDTRDDPLNARQGLLASSGLEYAPEALGSASGVNFIRSLNQVYYFRPWRGLVLASAARVGVGKGLGGVDLIPTERFRAGGARSVRGVAEDSLGPRSAIFGDVVGGNAMVLLNQEVRFPLYGWMRGVAFVDLGNVFARPSDIRLGDLVGSSGVGLRLVTPFGLLRVDYGKPWSTTAGPGSGRWSFGIGQAF